jgi:hypothetical protein
MSSAIHAGRDRRSVIQLLLAGTGVLVGGHRLIGAALADEAVKDVDLKPGSFVWQPELSPDGPVAIIVSIPEQLVYVFRNGIRIAVSTCSTGRAGHDTPTGVFTILEKAKVHYSSTYDEAPMPNMERLTWNGVALHAGNLPGYPASHGCIRLPPAFAANLFTVTTVGTPVIVAGDATTPTSLVDHGLILGTTAEEEAEVAVYKEEKPVFATTAGATSILVSGADQSMYVIENGDIVAEGKATIADPSKPLGENVFILEDGDGKGFTWQAIGFHRTDPNGAVVPDASVVERIKGPPNVIDAIKQRMKPGMVLVTTDLPATEDTRTAGKDFVVMTEGTS